MAPRRDKAERKAAGRGELPGADDPALALRQRARRRLIGAAVLLLAVAIVLPMVLDETPPPAASNVSIEIPSEKTPFTPRLALPPVEPAPIGEAAQAPAEEAGSARPSLPKASPREEGAGKSSTASPAEKGAAERSDAAPKPRSEASPAPSGVQPIQGKNEERGASGPTTAKPSLAAEPTKTATDKASPNGKFLLQAAAFSSEAAAKKLAERLRKAGVQPFIERIDTRDGARFRVRVGPYATRDEAQRVQSRLREIGVAAAILP
ncbi:MAG TPA: SPOR domain-containing protein, partial [Burkholderiaceae bacterium]|nr:SPOR domain-containing protein [Burkholderiaceae bacterium]